jgi:hypothetical protein
MQGLTATPRLAVLLGLAASAARAQAPQGVPSPGTTPVVTAFSINGGDFRTTSRLVSLTYAVGLGARVESYRVSESAGFVGATWMPYRESSSFELSPREGRKVIYLQVRTRGPDGVMRQADGQPQFVPNEHPSAVVADSIVLGLPDLGIAGVTILAADRAALTVEGSIVIENGGTDSDPGTVIPVAVALTASDADGAPAGSEQPPRMLVVSPTPGRGGRCTIAAAGGPGARKAGTESFECAIPALAAGSLEKITFTAKVEHLPTTVAMSIAVGTVPRKAGGARTPDRNESNNSLVSTIIVR